MDGAGRSWTFPVYIVSNELADGLPGDEEDLPPDGGNPHPFDGVVLPGEPVWVQQWVGDQQLQMPFQHVPVHEHEAEDEHLFGEPMVDDVQSVQNAMQEIVPIPLPPASPPRPPIRFVYSRRNRKAEDEIRKGKSVISPASAIASTSNAGKGKENCL
ncbi:hypothetical protein GUJ93_ZPchr0006g44554 [Zizania palustris]|uniref:Uncharacterized protein n=1 Tax=Zizania palustris TaxID=103762 RepID=A0A8J5T9D3_ZIZPA|nr:hypothetical protein GUJ93_ZPchr0006g44554 [Zizania palustris]